MIKILVFIYLIFNLTVAKRLGGDVQRRSASANTKGTFEFMYQCAQRNPGTHCTTKFYPLSTSVSQLALFLEGRSYQEALDLIRLRNRNEIREIFTPIKDVLYDPKLIGSPMLNLNVYTDENNRFCPSFSKEYNKTFGGKTRTVVYSAPEITADEINDEVRSEGLGGFTDLISTEMIKKGAGLHFISTFELTVIYDKKIQFTKKTIIKFKSGNKMTIVPGISGKGLVKYAEIKSLDAKTIEFVGEDGIYSYLIIYPNKRDGILELLEKLRTYSDFEKIISQGKQTCAKVTLINKDFVAKFDLKKSAKESNYARSFFKEGGLDLRGVSRKCNSTYISSILSEVRLNLDLISADSSEYEDNKCSEYPVKYVAEYPHLYLVTYTKKAAQYRTPVLGVVVDVTTN